MEEDLVEKILLGASVFRDERSLFPEFLPQKLPRREKEISRLATDFRPLIQKKGSIAINIAITMPLVPIPKAKSIKLTTRSTETVTPETGLFDEPNNPAM